MTKGMYNDEVSGGDTKGGNSTREVTTRRVETMAMAMTFYDYLAYCVHVSTSLLRKPWSFPLSVTSHLLPSLSSRTVNNNILSRNCMDGKGRYIHGTFHNVLETMA